ncbi:C-type lectin domain family 4 member E-like isoform X2 [Carassius auratus]|uniref:C-type lectin domain family 4 member E-like isoform X2 n=1 Tax=Carassius auratus TaxID=7957 RepID=A0A6P6KSX3_CARAU|nr:C-type lectin domain family 4 member E-like isoform X2 [Carassius auratus]
MSDDIYDNVIGTEFERMIKDRVDITVVNYESVDCVRDCDFRRQTKTLQPLQQTDGWIYYQSSFYYMSNETRNWTESSKDCQKRGADLIIINTREENDFVKKITAKREFWIGLTDSEVEGTWKWVDGSTLTYEFWERETNEPNGGTLENVSVTYVTLVP